MELDARIQVGSLVEFEWEGEPKPLRGRVEKFILDSHVLEAAVVAVSRPVQGSDETVMEKFVVRFPRFISNEPDAPAYAVGDTIVFISNAARGDADGMVCIGRVTGVYSAENRGTLYEARDDKHFWLVEEAFVFPKTVADAFVAFYEASKKIKPTLFGVWESPWVAPAGRHYLDV